MKKTIITVSLLLGMVFSAVAATKTLKAPAAPNPAEFAYKLVAVFGGADHILNEAELTEVVAFLQKNLPEATYPTSISTRLNREYNVRNSPRGDMTEERHALREYTPEDCAGKFIEKYDLDGDEALEMKELANALSKVIGLPSTRKKWSKGAIAKR